MADAPARKPTQWNQLATQPPTKLAAAAVPATLPDVPRIPSEHAPANYNPQIAPITRIEDAPPEEQRAVMDAVRSMQQAAQDAMNPDAPPPAAPPPTPPTVSDHVAGQAIGLLSGAIDPGSVLPPKDPPPTAAATPPPPPERQEFCPNCGFDVKQDPCAVSDDDKRAFLAALFSGSPFEKDYVLFRDPKTGAAYTVTFRTRTTGVEDVIGRQLRKEVADKRILMIDPVLAQSNFIYRMRRLQMAASLTRVRPGIEETLPLADSPEAAAMWKAGEGDEFPDDAPVALAEKKLYKKWAAPLYAAVWREFQFFEVLVQRLTEAANRPDFWKGTAGEH